MSMTRRAISPNAMSGSVKAKPHCSQYWKSFSLSAEIDGAELSFSGLELPLRTSKGPKGYYFPSIAVNGSSSTPPHSMPRNEYPFDSSGNYVGSWAVAGGSKSRSSSSRSSSTYRKSSSSSSSSSRTHRVSSGDTLYGISRRYGVSVSRIKSANRLSSDMIRKGQSLRIPR